MNYFVHPKAICESKNIGKDTKVWAFTHILPKAIIGKNCNICDNVFIENDVKIGNNVTIKCGVQIWDGLTIENNVFIGPNVTFTNDKFPKSKEYPDQFLKTKIEKGASLGANSTILPGIIIGQNAIVGAGAVVTHSVPANAIVIGNPAIINGYVGSTINGKSTKIKELNSEETLISGAKIINMNVHKDMRGNLMVSEFQKDLPFIPKRIFFVYDVPNSKIRGEHAHKTCEQLLVCIKGKVTALIDNGKERNQIELDSLEKGLYIPPMIWGTQYNYSEDAILLCFASKNYDNSDYIREYSEYLKLSTSKKINRLI
jgi:acetyltransferase-like isoleucine patch superfamily enzyme/dTDP-4-dehydrorhamnose 3,5-epimerase-like enzyme